MILDPTRPPAPGATPIDPTAQHPEAAPVSWERLTPDDYRKAAGVARRWCPIALQYARDKGADTASRPECNPDIVLIDLLLAHYWIGLDFDRLLRAPDAPFISAMVTLQLAIDRQRLMLPPGVTFVGFDARPARLNPEVTGRERTR
jgi:hypothetical protein